LHGTVDAAAIGDVDTRGVGTPGANTGGQEREEHQNT
jgi:hypothetical protein